MNDQAKAAKNALKKTLNLPQTRFPMKANLVQNEPASLKRWTAGKLYQQLRERRAGSPRYVFHDGPPYANGSIHLGHLLNKVLKDFVVRSQSMAGRDCPYIPGWDCHGLPIEHKVMQELGDKARELVAPQIRKRCADYAQKFVKLQAMQMQRLLTLADYDDPYLTMEPRYEAATLEVFARLVEEGLVFRQLKPVHWSIENRTALADAELEYYDRKDVSVYVRFPVRCEEEKLDLLIWTTTPWTLPANLAVAVSERAEYGVYPTAAGRALVVAVDLAKQVFGHLKQEAPAPTRVLRGSDLLAYTYDHPFVADGKARPVVTADYVTMEDGTGLVHTAPGHGVEDYQTAMRLGIDIYCPVRDDGTMDDTVPAWLRGKSVWEANTLVVEHLRQSGHLFHDHQFTHSYPHDWRGKTPVIFRATEQWFISVDQTTKTTGQSLRQMALNVTASDVQFIPAWGRNRMRGMLESRPDWCISRQRAWGLPIPGFIGPDEQPLLTAASVRAVASLIAQKGSDVWFHATPAELLANYDPQADAAAPAWAKLPGALEKLQKGRDIFDVWFESGSSWNAVMRQRQLAKDADASAITDLYLEGSDQHRGWFQLSLLPCLGATGKSPFGTVLTHGFMVDKDGRKMSKSLGNTLEVEELLKEFGADVCRWWVSTLNADNDIKVDHEFFRLAGEEYRKVRNTLRFVLSNLYDYDPQQHKVRFEDADASSLDAWLTGELVKLAQRVQQAYDQLSYRVVSESLFDFCNDTLSAVYLAAVKDRLYCDAPDSPRRRRTQTTLYRVADTLIRLLAPLLPHTADEAWQALRGEQAESVHLQTFADVQCLTQIPVHAQWPAVMKQRESWMKVLEDFRQQAGVDNPLDLGLRLPTSAAGELDLAGFDAGELADLCGISKVELSADATAPVALDLREQPRCERSWKRDGTVREYPYEGEAVPFSARDAGVLGLA